MAPPGPASRFRWIILGGLLLLAGGAAGLLLNGTPPDQAGAAEEWSPRNQGDRIRVEVLNAGGRQGMARRATGLLRDQGIDVVYLGNAAAFGRDSSLVLDRVGRPEAAEEVAAALGIASVRSEADPSLYLDVTVLLGSEWGDDSAGSADPDEAEEVRWWDLRRLWR